MLIGIFPFVRVELAILAGVNLVSALQHILGVLTKVGNSDAIVLFATGEVTETCTHLDEVCTLLNFTLVISKSRLSLAVRINDLTSGLIHIPRCLYLAVAYNFWRCLQVVVLHVAPHYHGLFTGGVF